MTKTILLKRMACVAALAVAAAGANAEMAGPDEKALALWEAALTEVKGMTPAWAVQGAEAFKESTDAGVPVVYLDVRKPEEWEKGVVEGAVLVSLTKLPTQDGMADLPADKTALIAVYCKSGHRSAMAIPLLHQLGYVNAVSMSGGYEAWVEAGYPVTGASE